MLWTIKPNPQEVKFLGAFFRILINSSFIVLIISIYSCSNISIDEDSRSITVNLKKLKDSVKVNLLRRESPGNVIDSTYSKDGSFVLKLSNESQDMYLLKIDDKTPYYFDFWFSGKDLSIKGNYEEKSIEVINDPNNDFVSEYREIPGKYEHLLLEAEEKASNEKELDEAWQKIIQIINSDKVDFLITKPNFLFSLKEIILLDKYISKEKLITFYDALNDNLKNTKEGKLIASYLERNRATIGKKFIDFSGFDVDGDSVRLSDFEGKIILLDFMANWCMPCHAQNKEEFTYLHKMYKDELVIVTYSLDEEMETWKKSVAKDSYQWTSITNLKGLADEVAFQYRIDPLPHSFLIDRNGIIRNEFVGYYKDNRIEEEFKKILSE